MLSSRERCIHESFLAEQHEAVLHASDRASDPAATPDSDSTWSDED
jgi:hypothetical protein